MFSSLKIAHPALSICRTSQLNEFFFPNMQGIQDFVEICADFRNFLALADKYSSKLAF